MLRQLSQGRMWPVAGLVWLAYPRNVREFRKKGVSTSEDMLGWDHGLGSFRAIRPASGAYALVRVSIGTGRRHQIRSHCAHIGHATVCRPAIIFKICSETRKAALTYFDFNSAHTHTHPRARAHLRTDVLYGHASPYARCNFGWPSLAFCSAPDAGALDLGSDSFNKSKAD